MHSITFYFSINLKPIPKLIYMYLKYITKITFIQRCSYSVTVTKKVIKKRFHPNFLK